MIIRERWLRAVLGDQAILAHAFAVWQGDAVLHRCGVPRLAG